jgi:hypothetical protein
VLEGKAALFWLAAFVAIICFFCPLGAPRSFGGWHPPRTFIEGAREELARFFADTGPHESGISRDGKPTYGDPFAKGASGGPLLPVYRLELPRQVSASGHIPGFVRQADRATGWLVIACTGTGCAFRVPIIYTEAMLNSVRQAMAQTIGKPGADGPDEEIKGLEAAAVRMEQLLATALATLTRGELEAYRVEGAMHDPWTQDCVDQAANGTSYAVVWAEYQLMRFHRPYYPGFKPGVLPHFYARLQRIGGGEVLAFDLYHRSDGIGQGSPIHAVPDPRKGT